jgi:diguanylate cyclase (GGDEF)-like protein
MPIPNARDEAHRTPKVVFVDDDVDLLESLRDRLRRMRPYWDMRFYDNSAEAMADIDAASDSQGTILVSDWHMPGADGLELCRTLAADSNGGPLAKPRSYVILLSGSQTTDHIVTALDAGADDFLSKPCDAEELIARIRVGMRVCQLEQRLREANQHLTELATTDPLTGLMNRRSATEILELELERSRRGVQSLGVALADIDHFKHVNDTLGHEAGDVALKEVARRFQRACRTYDSVVRWGGEEFLVICPNAARDEIKDVAERMREAVAENPITISQDQSVSLTVSVGTAAAPPGREVSPEAAVAQADRALYGAKHAGRDRVHWGGTPAMV